jgi:hypothetical protein
LGYFCNFQISAQSKQSHNRQKFAESGHPGRNQVEEKENQERQENVHKEKHRSKFGAEGKFVAMAGVNVMIFGKNMCNFD